MRPPASEQVDYQRRVVQVITIGQSVMRRDGRASFTEWDGGRAAMLPASFPHTLRFTTGLGNVVVPIQSDRFQDPNYYRTAIEAAVMATSAKLS